MNYLYGRKGMGQAIPPIQVPYGQSCVYGGGNPDNPQGCPQGTRCTNVRGGSEISGQRGVCMPTCISTVECPPGLVCVDGTCIHPPDINPPPPNDDTPKDGRCASYRNIPISVDGKSTCIDPDSITDADLMKNSVASKRRLYNARDLAVGRLGTEQDIEEVRLNKTLARMEVSERQYKYNLMTQMVRRLAQSYELTRQANEIAIIANDSRMITITLNDEKEIRDAILAIRSAQFRLRQINIAQTSKGLTISGIAPSGQQGLGALPVLVVKALWVGGVTLLAGGGIYGVKKLFFDTKSQKEILDITLAIHEKEVSQYIACHKRLTAEGMQDSIKDVCSKPRTVEEIRKEVEKDNQSVFDQLSGAFTSVLKLAAIGAVGYIAVPIIKDYVDDYRSKKSRS